MRSGATFERRFVLVSPEDHDVPGVERWLARDERLRRKVTVFVVTSVAPSAVRRSASRASGIGDPRLARVLAAGTSDAGAGADERVTYVVVERAEGRPLGDILARRNLSHPIAAALVGSLAQALRPLSARGLHHGAIRASAVTVTDAGSVLLSGLGVDGELRAQAGEGVGMTERADAAALAGLYVLALTGREAGDASEDDLPRGLPRSAWALAVRTIAGDAPARLQELSTALGGSRAALRDFAAQVRALPVRREVLAQDIQGAFGRSGAEVASDAVLARARRVAERDVALRRCDGVVGLAVASERLDEVTRPLLEDERARKARAAREAAAAARAAAGPTREEREQFDDLQSWDVIAEVQNATVPPSAWEAFMRRLQRRWPQSDQLAARVQEASTRARRPGPLVGAPIIIGLGLLGVVLAFVYALGQMPEGSPDDGPSGTSNPYPAFTYPATTYTPQPEPSASPAPEE